MLTEPIDPFLQFLQRVVGKFVRIVQTGPNTTECSSETLSAWDYHLRPLSDKADQPLDISSG